MVVRLDRVAAFQAELETFGLVDKKFLFTCVHCTSAPFEESFSQLTHRKSFTSYLTLWGKSPETQRNILALRLETNRL